MLPVFFYSVKIEKSDISQFQPKDDAVFFVNHYMHHIQR